VVLWSRQYREVRGTLEFCEALGGFVPLTDELYVCVLIFYVYTRNLAEDPA